MMKNCYCDSCEVLYSVLLCYTVTHCLIKHWSFLALDAMRKAYEEELEQEKEKYRTALKTMFTDNYVDDIRRRHECVDVLSSFFFPCFSSFIEYKVSEVQIL